MELYKKTGTNPLSSCLPLLLQMPIFFGLFSVLQHAQNQSAENPAGVGLLNADLSASFGSSDLWGAPLHLAISTADGNVTVIEGTNRIDSVRGKLRLVSFADAQKLEKEGGNLYSAGQGIAPQPDTASRVRQGVIEKSNVNSVHEMSRLIEITRTYTQISSMLQQQHDLHRTAIEKLADVPA
jgi:hypothetical protein